MKRKPLKIRKNLNLIGPLTSFLLFVVALWLCGFVVFLSLTDGLKEYPVSGKTDAIVVLTGGPDRINAGLDLLQAKLSGKLLISGVDRNVSVAKILSMWGKGNVCCIMLGYAAHNTHENAVETRNWTRQYNVKSIRLVTSLYHMPRALVEMKHALPEMQIISHPVDTNKESMTLAFEEYNKTLYTWLHLTFNI